MPIEQIAYAAMMIVGAFVFGYLVRGIGDKPVAMTERVRVKAHSGDETFNAWWDDYGSGLGVSYYIAEEIWAAAVANKPK